MSYRFNDSEKFRANFYLLIGLACFSPVGVLFNDYLVNEKLPSGVDLIITGISIFIGIFSISKAYGIIYDKDKSNA